MKNYKFILGHAESTPTSLTLTHSPAGWDKKGLSFVRNETYKSIMRSTTLSLRFVREGRDYIESAYNTSGINALITVTVQVLDKSDMTYDTYYTGILDLSSLVITDIYAECPIIDSDRLSKFKSRDEIEYAIGTGYSKNFKIEGVEIKEQLYVTFISSTATTPNDTENAIENTQIEEIPWESSTRDYNNTSDDTEDIDYKAECTINWNFTFPTGGGTMDMYAEISENGTYRTIAYKQVNSISASTESGSYTAYIEDSYTIPSGGYLGRIRLRIFGTTGTTGSVVLSDGDLYIFRVTPPLADSTIQAIMPDEAIQKLINIITDDTTFRSSLVGRTDSSNYTYPSDGELSMIGLANGAGIRGFSQSQRPFKTTFKDLFNALYSIRPIGFWYNQELSRWELNDIEDFYKDEEILNLGEVSELEITIDEIDYYNSIIAGYDSELEYESINGIQNFCTKSTYINDVERIDGEYDISTNYRTDDYGIELTRKMYYLNNYSVDVNADEDNFMIYGQRDGSNFQTVQGYDDFTVITGTETSGQNVVYSPATRLNLDLAPKRNLLRHKSLLGVPMYISEGDINFISSQFNFDLGLQKSGETSVIYESDDITDLGEPLYHAIRYVFNNPVSKEIIDQLLTDPHGYVTFTYKGTTYKGHIIEVSTEPYNRSGNWTLIKYNPNR